MTKSSVCLIYNYFVNYKNMSSTHLSTGRLNVGIIQKQARKQLLCLLEKCDGTKVLIILITFIIYIVVVINKFIKYIILYNKKLFII